MIDLHCHLLHSIDDGAGTLEDSLNLARVAVADGITTCAVTPHIHPGRYENRKQLIALHAKAFQETLDQQGIALKVYPGAELRASEESLALLEAGEVPFLGEVRGMKVLLLEFPHSGLPAWGVGYVYRLLELNILPLIAHPERNKHVMADISRLQPYVAAGCWFQITGGALTGHFGKPAEKAAWALMEQETVNIVASDAHNLHARPPLLADAMARVREQYGARRAERLFFTTPASILGLG